MNLQREIAKIENRLTEMRKDYVTAQPKRKRFLINLAKLHKERIEQLKLLS